MFDKSKQIGSIEVVLVLLIFIILIVLHWPCDLLKRFWKAVRTTGE